MYMGFHDIFLLVWFIGYLICIIVLSLKVIEITKKSNYKAGKSDVVVIAIMSVASWFLIFLCLFDYVREKFSGLRK